jgi:uncharacterized protein YneF (UPF0154 family)
MVACPGSIVLVDDILCIAISRPVVLLRRRKRMPRMKKQITAAPPITPPTIALMLLVLGSDVLESAVAEFVEEEVVDGSRDDDD